MIGGGWVNGNVEKIIFNREKQFFFVGFGRNYLPFVPSTFNQTLPMTQLSHIVQPTEIIMLIKKHNE